MLVGRPRKNPVPTIQQLGYGNQDGPTLADVQDGPAPPKVQSYPVPSETHDVKLLLSIFFQLLFSISSCAPYYEPLSYINYNINIIFFHLLTDLLISYVINHS